MFLYLVILFTVVPAVELYLLITVGQQIGVLETIWIILLTGVIGAALAKSQGRSLLIDIQRELHQGQIPANKLIQGMLVFAGGLLLLTPGFITDALGLSMVIPITRIPFALFLKYQFQKMLAKGTMKFTSVHFGGGQSPRGSHFESYTVYTSSDLEKAQTERDVTPRKVIDITPKK
ncbi:MAG: FxsA family protein [Bdellovibrionales bacterium]|nr:FxsA family protein [Bdellovibrionales bacterium]